MRTHEFMNVHAPVRVHVRVARVCACAFACVSLVPCPCTSQRPCPCA